MKGAISILTLTILTISCNDNKKAVRTENQ
jgi:hypothetical protein